MRLARLVAMGTIVFSAGALSAQKSATTTGKAPVGQDSAKLLRKDAAHKKAQAKAAMAAGDTAKAKVLKKQAKSEAKQAKAMKKEKAVAKAAAAPVKKP